MPKCLWRAVLKPGHADLPHAKGEGGPKRTPFVAKLRLPPPLALQVEGLADMIDGVTGGQTGLSETFLGGASATMGYATADAAFSLEQLLAADADDTDQAGYGFRPPGMPDFREIAENLRPPWFWRRPICIAFCRSK